MEKEKKTLRELRARKNLTQEEVSNALGVSTPTYNAWENNTGMIKLGNAIKLCDFYGVSLSEIEI